MCAHRMQFRLEHQSYWDTSWKRITIHINCGLSGITTLHLDQYNSLFSDDQSSLENRANAFSENIGKLMDAYAFQIGKTFGRDAPLVFSWVYGRTDNVLYSSLRRSVFFNGWDI